MSRSASLLSVFLTRTISIKVHPPVKKWPVEIDTQSNQPTPYQNRSLFNADFFLASRPPALDWCKVNGPSTMKRLRRQNRRWTLRHQVVRGVTVVCNLHGVHATVRCFVFCWWLSTDTALQNKTQGSLSVVVGRPVNKTAQCLLLLLEATSQEEATRGSWHRD